MQLLAAGEYLPIIPGNLGSVIPAAGSGGPGPDCCSTKLNAPECACPALRFLRIGISSTGLLLHKLGLSVVVASSKLTPPEYQHGAPDLPF